MKASDIIFMLSLCFNIYSCHKSYENSLPSMSNSFVSLPLDSNVLATRFVTWYVQKDSDTLTAIFYCSRCIFINLFLTLVNTTQKTASSNKHMTMSMSLFSLLLSQAYLRHLLICIFTHLSCGLKTVILCTIFHDNDCDSKPG